MSSLTRNENELGTENLLNKMEGEMTKLIQDIDSFEKEKKGVDSEAYEQIQKVYAERIKNMDSELNRGIIKSEGKARISIIMTQKALRTQRKRLQDLLDAKKQEYEETLFTNRTTAATETFEKEDSEEDSEGEIFGLLNNQKKNEMFMNYEHDDKNEDSERIRKDMEIMRDIIKDMNDIAKKRAERGEFMMFDIEEKDEDFDDHIKFKKNKASTGKTQIYRIIAFSVLCIVFTTLLILK